MASARGPLPKTSLWGIRLITKTFTVGLPDIPAANRLMAQRLQKSVVLAFDASVAVRERDQRPTHYLRNALAAEEAIVYNSTGFVYLRAGYLESSPARMYWRNLEEGTNTFVGRVLEGYFVSGGGEYSPLGDARLGRIARRTDMRFHGRMSLGGRGGVIERAIEPHRYIEKGVADWQAAGGIQPVIDAIKTIRIIRS